MRFQLDQCHDREFPARTVDYMLIFPFHTSSPVAGLFMCPSPSGPPCLYRLDVILRSEIVDRAKAGDKCTFTGTFIVVPDVSQLGIPGVNSEMMRENKGGRGDGGVASQGVTGLKSLGVRDLLYKTAFLGCMVQKADATVSVVWSCFVSTPLNSMSGGYNGCEGGLGCRGAGPTDLLE
jgi:hypothetical protein